MKWTILTTALVALEVTAIQLIDRKAAGQEPKVVRHTIRRGDVPNLVRRDGSRFHRRQDGVVDVPLSNNISSYYLNVTVGTPAQDLRVVIDTGSSDLWFNSVDSDICDGSSFDDDQNQCYFGTYDANSSSTYNYINSDFYIQYGDGTSAAGDYATDVIDLGGGGSIEQQQFAVVYNSEVAVGVMGIGYQLNEAVQTTAEVYNNIPMSLLEAGNITSLAYSIWLNDLDSSEGEILFGGINRNKFEGELTTLPVVPYRGYYAQLAIRLNGIAISGQNLSSSTTSTTVVLDSGSTLSTLPSSIMQFVFQSVGATPGGYDSYATVPCDLANYIDTVDFQFGSATIRVPINELVIPEIASSYQDYFGVGEDNECTFGLQEGSISGTYILGDTFLRSAYVVYDLGNNEISLAQTVFNSTSDDIVEISNGTAVDSVSGSTTTGASQATSGPTLTVSTVVQTVTPSAATSSAADAAAVESVSVVSVFGALAALLLW